MDNFVRCRFASEVYMKAPIDGEEFRQLSDVKTAAVESKAPDLPKTKDDTPDSDKWADHSALDTPPAWGAALPQTGNDSFECLVEASLLAKWRRRVDAIKVIWSRERFKQVIQVKQQVLGVVQKRYSMTRDEANRMAQKLFSRD
ncbi:MULTISPECIES: hypothetical protein [unclassified Pseudomonas]|uniref:hypothetical protein n=2 Tax=Pseudomonas TaxID=286 RepID=UPI0007317A2C|nr:hypothetical protein [Pseudomonas sp. EGD-AKN5]KSW24217.1 hypothetical protein AOX63_10745 [Pseudomonas sp. ADP]OBP07757.1 hypothetical protein BAE52_26750 [Pseudomonas sp. EGD-AKN5]QOF86753.1 hypothetical protein IG194_08765 [Pseudomonas sp. ADPe]